MIQGIHAPDCEFRPNIMYWNKTLWWSLFLFCWCRLQMTVLCLRFSHGILVSEWYYIFIVHMLKSCFQPGQWSSTHSTRVLDTESYYMNCQSPLKLLEDTQEWNSVSQSPRTTLLVAVSILLLLTFQKEQAWTTAGGYKWGIKLTISHSALVGNNFFRHAKLCGLGSRCIAMQDTKLCLTHIHEG